MYKEVVDFIRSLSASDPLPLHEPCFKGREKEYVLETIDSTFVSSVGAYVNRFEESVASYVGVKHAVAMVNGTAALHVALLVAGAQPGDLVLTQSLAFIATCNAIQYCGATPLFMDVEQDTLGMSPAALEHFLQEHADLKDGRCVHRSTGKTIRVCLPVHLYGHAARIDAIQAICKVHHLTLVEDAAEAMGSRYKNQHLGTFGSTGIFSFNGNKIITTGGGGILVTDDENLAKKAKHLSTTAKLIEGSNERHDQLGYNYRMPNLNAALGCAQLEQLDGFIAQKRQLARQHKNFFDGMDGVECLVPLEQTDSNAWLNTILLPDRKSRDAFLREMHDNGIGARPAWQLMHHTVMYSTQAENALPTSEQVADRLVTLPSSVALVGAM